MGFEIVEVQRAVVRVDVDVSDGRPGIGCGQHPRSKIGIVVEPADDDLVAWPPGPSQSAGQRQRQRCHVGAKGDCARIVAADEIRSRLVSGREHVIALATGGKQTSMIRVVLNVVSTHRVDHSLWHLSSRRTVEEGRRIITSLTGEGRELTANFVEVIVQ